MRIDKKSKRIFCWLLGILCLLIAAVMAGMAGRTWLAYQSSEKGLEQMYQDMDMLLKSAGTSAEEDSADFDDQKGDRGSPLKEGIGDEGAVERDNETLPKTVHKTPADIQVLKQLNLDVAGWIQIQDTVINYPVMHTPRDSNYYYHKDFYGNYSAYGMIYMDGSCNLEDPSPNLLIYGHHMKNGGMFASIEQYASKQYKEEHPRIRFTTAKEAAEYEVVGVIRISADIVDQNFMKMLAAQKQEDYEQLLQYIRSNSLYQTGVTAQWPEQLITLTTCEYTKNNGRFLVFGRKVDQFSRSLSQPG